jgi:hypothetical protein
MLQVPGTFTRSSLRIHLRVGTSFAEGLSASKITLVSRYEELTMPQVRGRNTLPFWDSSLKVSMKLHIDDWPFHEKRIVTEL